MSGYILVMIVGAAISGAAALWVRSSYSKYSRRPSTSGLTGAQTARMILDRNGLTNVRVEPVPGYLTDHYDPRSKVVRLSENNFKQRSIAAVSVAAHEVGHAIQDATGYIPMKLRSGLFPVVAFSSQIWLPLFFVGIFIGTPLGAYALAFGVLLFVLAFRIRKESGNDNTEANASSRPTAEQRFSAGNDLVSASDSTPKDDTPEADPAQDVRGREVLDRSGREVGTVEDSYVLIPTEAVGGISDEQVTLNQDRDKVADSPRFEGENGPDRQYQITIYRYYGYA